MRKRRGRARGGDRRPKIAQSLPKRTEDNTGREKASQELLSQEREKPTVIEVASSGPSSAEPWQHKRSTYVVRWSRSPATRYALDDRATVQ